MPYAAPRICGCGHRVPYGVMCQCQQRRAQERKARHDANRPSARQRGYDSKWDRERAIYLAANPLCVHCLEYGEQTPSKIVDHKIPHRGDRKLFWSRSNWQALCAHCHNVWKQAHEKWGEL